MTITEANLRALAGDLLKAGVRVTAPVKAWSSDEIDYQLLTDPERMVLDPGRLPRRSIKDLFFPPTEALLQWKQQGGQVDLKDVPITFPKQLVLGAKPCDAAGVDVLDKVMGWDYRDELWFGRREATTVVTVACSGVDGSCFCTAVGLGPDSTRGSDVMLTQVNGGFSAEAITEKGTVFLQEHQERFARGEAAGGSPALPRSPITIDAKKIQGWLEKGFEDEYWKGLSLRCHGCGACACVCPTCHCFDIVDEPEGVGAGTRRRNWDTCQAAKFTLHASGHNPRGSQTERFRQRVMHKFNIYPKRFGEILCTGCGRCARACPAGMDLPQVLEDLNRKAAGGTP